MTHTVTLCALCPLGLSGFAERLTLPGYQIRLADCLSGCTRSSTIAFRAPGKVAYLFGRLTADDLPEIIAFAEAYLASADGVLEDAGIFAPLRAKALARIPG